MLSALKVIDEVMKLLSDIEVHKLYVRILSIYIASLLYDNFHIVQNVQGPKLL